MIDPRLNIKITGEDLFSAVMNGVVAGMAKAKQSVEKIGSTAQKAADQTAQAFKTLNIRSAFDIKAEQNKIIAAFNEIKNSGKASADEVARAQEAMKSKLRDLQGELTNTGQVSQKTGATLGDVFKGVGMASFYFNNIKTAVESAWQAMLDVTRPAMEMQKLNAMFKASSGSAELAAKDLAYVRTEADRLGLSFQDVAVSFAKFAAGTRNTALEGEKAKEVFSAVAEASTALQLSTDETNGILLAFTQILGKGKVSAEELNQVAERLPGALDLISGAMGMTTREFRKAAEEGKVLSAEVLAKIPKALRDLYGAAAADAAAGPAAQLNRLKTATFELVAALGQGPMKVVADLAAALSWLANAAKTAVGWLSTNSWGQSLSSLGAGLGFAAAALTIAATAQSAYAAAAWAATTATNAFTASLLANPLVLAAAAALASLVAAINAVGNAMVGANTASDKSAAAMRKTTEEMRKASAERKRIDDAYEKAVGVSLERQLEKRKAQLEQDRRAIDEKFSQDLAAAKGNAAEEEKIMARLAEDKTRIENAYYADVDKLRDENLKKQQADANTELQSRINHLKRLGQTRDADSLDIAARNRADLKEVERHYKQIEDAARANGRVLVGLDQERAAALDELRKKHALDAAQRGYEEGKKELDAYKAIMDSRSALMLAAAGDNLRAQQMVQVEIERMEIDHARRRYQAAATHFQDVAALYPKNSDQYRAALGDMASAHKSYLDTSSAAYRKYAAVIKAIDQQIKDFRLGIQQRISDLQQKSMTDQQKFADNQRRLGEAMATAEALRAQGQYAEAMKYNKQAEDLAARLDSNIDVAISTLKQVARQGESILEDSKDAPQAALNKLREIDAQPLNDKFLKVVLDEPALQAAMDKISTITAEEKKKVDVVVEIDSASYNATREALLKLAAISAGLLKTSTQSAPDVSLDGYFEGGKIGVGSSLRDSVHALVARDEWIINNKATRFWGDGLMAAINAPFSSAGRALQDALSRSVAVPAVAADGSIPNLGSIDLNVGGAGSFAVQAPVNVLAELTTAVRRVKMTRPQ